MSIVASGLQIGVTSLGAITGLLALLIAAGGLLGTALRVGRQSQNIANYREAAQSWEAKAQAQGIELDTLREQITGLQQQNASQEAQLATLRDLVTGKSTLLELSTQVVHVVEKIESAIIGRDTFAQWQVELRDRIDVLSGEMSRMAGENRQRLEAVEARLEAMANGGH